MSSDGDDIDAELLALEGGESSEDEGDYDHSQAIDDRSPSPSTVKPSVEKVEDTGVRRGVAQKVRARRGRRARRRDDSEDEDDEIFESEPESLIEEEMRRSESAADAAGSPVSHDDDAPLYPIEGKFMSQADRTWLLSLPELEREQELEKRVQEQIRRQQDLQLKRALANNRATTASKRKAADADLDEAARKSSRPKMERGAKSALDKYKKAREQAGADRERRDGRRAAARDDRSSSKESDRDADGESEVEWAEPADRRRDEPLPELPDFNHCRVGRSNFAQICFYPGFEETITGCFARVSVGPDRETSQNMYRMALIKGEYNHNEACELLLIVTGFREGKPYQLETSSGKKFLTDQYAIVAQGKSEKPWPFAACSDSKFTHEEMDRYLDTLKSQHLRIPTRKHLNNKVDDIDKLLNRRWTDEDISKKIQKQKSIADKYDPANAAKLKEEQINKRKQQAEEVNDFEEIARCNAELQTLHSSSSNVHAAGKTPTPARPLNSAQLSEQDRLARQNALTRKTNSETVRKALLEERRQEIKLQERAAAEAKAKAEAEAAKSRLGVPGSDADLFGDGSDISRSGTPANGVKKIKSLNGSRAGTPLSQGIGKRPLGALRSGRKNDDDVIGAMDLGIDIEI